MRTDTVAEPVRMSALTHRVHVPDNVLRWDRDRVVRLLKRYMPFIVLAVAVLIAAWHAHVYW
jgi:hypothetical protein